MRAFGGRPHEPDRLSVLVQRAVVWGDAATTHCFEFSATSSFDARLRSVRRRAVSSYVLTPWQTIASYSNRAVVAHVRRLDVEQVAADIVADVWDVPVPPLLEPDLVALGGVVAAGGDVGQQQVCRGPAVGELLVFGGEPHSGRRINESVRKTLGHAAAELSRRLAGGESRSGQCVLGARRAHRTEGFPVKR